MRRVLEYARSASHLMLIAMLFADKNSQTNKRQEDFFKDFIMIKNIKTN